MGLDAVVYKHRSHLTLGSELKDALSDDRTGEVYLADDTLSKRYPRSFFIALHKRLGNLEMISTLRSELEVIVGHKNTDIQQKWLYSAFHAGDVVPLKNLAELEKEIDTIKQKSRGNKSSEIEAFLENLTELIVAARKENNPIVFI